MFVGFTKTFKNGGRNVKGYPLFAEIKMLYAQGFIEDECLSIHCTVQPAQEEEEEEKEEEEIEKKEKEEDKTKEETSETPDKKENEEKDNNNETKNTEQQEKQEEKPKEDDKKTENDAEDEKDKEKKDENEPTNDEDKDKKQDEDEKDKEKKDDGEPTNDEDKDKKQEEQQGQQEKQEEKPKEDDKKTENDAEDEKDKEKKDDSEPNNDEDKDKKQDEDEKGDGKKEGDTKEDDKNPNENDTKTEEKDKQTEEESKEAKEDSDKKQEEEEEQGQQEGHDEKPKAKPKKTVLRFHSTGEAYLQINGFSAQEHGIIFSKWVKLEPAGRWRAMCYPRGKTTFSTHVSVGFQVEVAAAGPTALTTISEAGWEAPCIVSAHVVTTKKDINADFDFRGVQIFSDTQTTYLNQAFVHVDDIIAAAQNALDGDTLTIRCTINTFHATSPSKTVTTYAAPLAKNAEIVTAAAYGEVANAFTAEGGVAATAAAAAATALGTFGFLAERLEGAARTCAHLSHICEVYKPAMCEIPELEARENELLGSCEDPERAKELSVTIAKTLKILLEKIDSPDDANNVSASNENDGKQKDGKRAEADSALETAPKQLKDSEAKLTPELPEYWKKLKVTAERVTFTCESGAGAVRCLHSWDTMMSDECKIIEKEAKARKKDVDKLRASKQSMLGKKIIFCVK